MLRTIPERHLERIRQIRPDLTIEKIDFNTEGMVNEVVIVNDALVFRFCRSEAVQAELAHEFRMINLIRPYLSVKLPEPIELQHDLVVYPYLAGRQLKYEELRSMEPSAQQKIADELGIFLRQLHSIPPSLANWEIPPCPAPTSREAWLNLRTRIEEKVYPTLMAYQVEWCESLLHEALDREDFFQHEPAIIHADLAGYHILLDERGEHISAVLDFGTCGLGDPALDIGNLITHLGESFIAKIQPEYPAYDSLMSRARFYAKSIELQWALLGMETGEKSWFTAHLGNPKDILI